MTAASGFAETKAVVTGGSSGIGQATCLALAAAGTRRMVIHYRSNHEGAERTATVVEQAGCQCDLVPADLANAADVDRLVDTSFASLGSIDTWVNNAGADVLTGQAATLDFDAKLARLLEVDLVGTIRLSRRLATKLISQQSAPAQRATRPPSIVFIGWDQAPFGMEGDAGQLFGPVKAAVMAFAASLAQTLAPDVRVNTVAAGWIRTAWGQSASEDWNRRATGQALMRRWGTPEDVARAVLFASDPDNHFITGQTLEVNGGWDRRWIERDGSV